jgi:hypothetical protein
MTQRWRAFVLAAGTVATSMALLAATASPAAAVSGGVSTNCGYFDGQVCDGVGQLLPVGTGSGAVAVTCHAATPYVVQATGVGCYLEGAFTGVQLFAPTVYTQGQTSSTTIAFASVLNEPYRLCVGAGIVDINGSPRPISGYRCFFPL